MVVGIFSEFDVTLTPRLRAFLRAELAQVVHFMALDGEYWNPHKIAAEIRDNPGISGSVSDDTIVRFLKEPEPHQTRRTALEAIAGFLLFFEFISERDLRHYGHPAYDRAASALVDLFKSSIDAERNCALLGVYRYFRTMGRKRLAEWVLTIGSPDEGRSISVNLAVAVFQLDEPEYFLEQSGMLDPYCYTWVRDNLPDLVCELDTNAPGLAIVTPAMGLAVIGGDEAALHGALLFDEMHWQDGEHVGMRTRFSSGFTKVEDGSPILQEAPLKELDLVRRQTEQLSFYPQGQSVRRLPKIDLSAVDSSNGSWKGRGLTFQGAVDGRMSEKDQAYLEAEQQELAVEAALAKCSDETQRLALSIDLWRADHAIAAITAGADVDALHETRGIPMVHAAASLGMRGVIHAMLEKGVTLTVRDRFNRLPSACTGNSERTIQLRDELAAAQAAQFEEKGLDPRRPQTPQPDS